MKLWRRQQIETGIAAGNEGVRVKPRRRLAAAAAGVLTASVAFAAVACSGSGAATQTATPPAAPTSPATAPAVASPASTVGVTLSGNLTLDGAPVESQFVGVRVVKDGLSAACQATIPPVQGGRYQVDVLPDGDERGCGAPGSSIILWIYAGNRFVFSTESIPWPAAGGPVTFDATFSSGSPNGATEPVTAFKGHLFDNTGQPMPAGTVVEAYVGGTRCGLTSLRAGEEVEEFYTLMVSGPESVPGCVEGAHLSFRLNGQDASPAAVNNLSGDAGGSELDLTLR